MPRRRSSWLCNVLFTHVSIFPFADNFISTLLLRACNDKRFIRDAALAALGTLADSEYAWRTTSACLLQQAVSPHTITPFLRAAASDSVSTVVSFLRHSCSKSRPLVLASAEHSRRHLSALRPAALASLDLQAVAPLIACFMRSKAAEARAAAAAMGCTLALARGEEAWQEALRATCSPSDVAALVASTAAALQEHRRAAQARADACGAADDGPDGSSGAGGGATAVACSAAIPVAASASSSWSSPVPCRSASGRRSLGAPGSAAHSTPRQLALRAFIRERSAQKAGAADGVDVVAAPYSAGGASASATATATAATSASAPRPAAAAPIAPSGVSLPATIAELGPASPSALTTHGMRCTFISLDGTETTACSSSSSAAAAATGAAASSSSSSRSLAAAAPPRRSDATPAVARVLRLSVGGPGEPLPRYVPSPVSAAAAAGAGAAALAALSTGVSNVASADAAASGKVAAQLIAAAAAAPVAIVDKENGGGL